MLIVICGQGGIRTPEDVSHLIYSQAQLTALVPTHLFII